MKKRNIWKYLFAVLFNFIVLSPFIYSKELVIGTTFSTESLSHLMDEWNKQPNSLPVRTLNRTSNSLIQLLSSEKINEIDLILSSSPMLFYHLQIKQKLAFLPDTINSHKQFVPDILTDTTTAFSLSGYGILSNIPLLKNADTHIPTDWIDLTSPHLRGLVMISSPTRSDTTHIMIEALLQKYGWQNGWTLISQIMANIGTISSRSFGVAEKIQANLGAAGVTIDNYANLLTKYNKNTNSSLVFKPFPNFPVSPTFIAMTTNSHHSEQALAFIQFLLSDSGQTVLYDGKMGKYPIIPLPPQHFLYDEQQFLFSQPQIDYELMLKRQEMVKLLFEHYIVHRLIQIQENWHTLYHKEQQNGKTLAELRQILSLLPVTEEQAIDNEYLNNFNSNEELLKWQQFFILQQTDFIKALENL